VLQQLILTAISFFSDARIGGFRTAQESVIELRRAHRWRCISPTAATTVADQSSGMTAIHTSTRRRDRGRFASTALLSSAKTRPGAVLNSGNSDDSYSRKGLFSDPSTEKESRECRALS
jgi:hypothetical protein